MIHLLILRSMAVDEALLQLHGPFARPNAALEARDVLSSMC